MPIFPQNTVVIIWDFDKTLIPGYMEDPLFRHYGVDAREFWAEVDGLKAYYRKAGADLVQPDTLYLDHILTYVREGIFAGLTNKLLGELGGEITFFPGIPAFFDQIAKGLEIEPTFAEHKITLEHYVISSGLRQMILGSAAADKVSGVWACEFGDRRPGPGYLDEKQPELFDAGAGEREITHPIYAIDNTSKTRAVFEINKGANVSPAIDVNSKMAREDRRVPFQNMIYVADGASDVPVFSVVRRHGGKCFAVYEPHSQAAFEQANRLLEQSRVHAFGEANYEEGSQTYMWLDHTIRQIASRIVDDRNRAISERLGDPPRHLD